MSPVRRLVVIGMIVAITSTACSGEEAGPTTTTTSSTPTTTTTTVSTTVPPSTSTIVYADLEVLIPGSEDAQRAVSELYGWIGDPTRPAPDVPEGLAEHAADAVVEGSATLDGTLYSAEIGDRGQVGVVTIGDDVVLLVDEGDGWTVVGADLPRFALAPWLGAPQRHVLIIGTDARPGQDQQNFRADSIHVLSSNVAEGGGGILGFPRDTYVEASYGFDKFTHVNVYGGQEEMVEVTAEMSGLPVEGYIVTGFLNFQRLVNDFGGVYVDVPFAFNDWRAEAFISAGYQLLWGDKALGFSRSRRLAGGDFTRSYHQGVVIAAALSAARERADITGLPDFLALLDTYTWTDLELSELLTLAAGAFYIDPELVGNQVLPGTVTTRGGASVVVLTDGAEDLFRDLDDGMLTPDD
jgi:LCP family protein required for cell wall assembly